jgi:uncharacterized protein YndB with AHSA1/START domain
MSNPNNVAGQCPGLKLTLSRIINAPCEMIFRAWAEPEQLLEWFGPEGGRCQEITADVKPGGAFRFQMISPRGERIAIGKYLEVVPNKRLQFTWSWENYAMPNSVVTVEFEDLGDKTLLILTHTGLPDQEDVEQHTHGWNAAVKKFASLMELEKVEV